MMRNNPTIRRCESNCVMKVDIEITVVINFDNADCHALGTLKPSSDVDCGAVLCMIGFEIEFCEVVLCMIGFEIRFC
jgi:hypothetical protein